MKIRQKLGAWQMSLRCSHEGADFKSWIKVTLGDLGENHTWLIGLFLKSQGKCNQQEASNFTHNWPDLPKLVSLRSHCCSKIWASTMDLPGSLTVFVPTTKEGVKACYNPYSCVQISNCVRSWRSTLSAVAEESSISMGRNLATIPSEHRIGMS